MRTWHVNSHGDIRLKTWSPDVFGGPYLRQQVSTNEVLPGTLAYMHLIHSCVNCHKLVRNDKPIGSVENATSAKGTGTFLLRGLRKNEPVPGGVNLHQGTSTAAPCNLPFRSASNAVLASDKANVVVSVWMGTVGAICRNSSASRRVRLATDRTIRSPQSKS